MFQICDTIKKNQRELIKVGWFTVKFHDDGVMMCRALSGTHGGGQGALTGTRKSQGENHCKALPPISTAGAALFLAGGM